jgi:cell shape-determining protein MreD
MPGSIPLIVLTLTFLLTAIPLGLPAEATFAPPMTMLAAIFFCAASPSLRLPAWLAMIFGLAADIATASPVGYWGLLALLAHGAGASVAQERWARRFSLLWPLWAATAAAIGLAAWGIASLYFLSWIGWQPVAYGVALSILALPLIGAAVRVLRALLPDRDAAGEAW